MNNNDSCRIDMPRVEKTLKYNPGEKSSWNFFPEKSYTEKKS